MSELFLYRDKPTLISTPGIFAFQGERICDSLEDVDRGLCMTMSCKEIREKKVYGETAIPYGRYPIVWYDSPKHGRVLLLKYVPGFSYVEIHKANWAHELKGCLTAGLSKGKDVVWDSDKAIKKINRLVIDNDIKFINVLKQI